MPTISIHQYISSPVSTSPTSFLHPSPRINPPESSSIDDEQYSLPSSSVLYNSTINMHRVYTKAEVMGLLQAYCIDKGTCCALCLVSSLLKRKIENRQSHGIMNCPLVGSSCIKCLGDHYTKKCPTYKYVLLKAW